MSTLRIPTETNPLNSAILFCTVITAPETRQTPDNSNTIVSFLVQFAAPKPEDPPFRIKATAWNKLADEAIATIKNGSQVIIEGRLRLDTIDRGTYKEKRTELVASRIHAISATSQPMPVNYAQSVAPNVAPIIAPQAPNQQSQEDYDDIPY